MTGPQSGSIAVPEEAMYVIAKQALYIHYLEQQLAALSEQLKQRQTNGLAYVPAEANT